MTNYTSIDEKIESKFRDKHWDSPMITMTFGDGNTHTVTEKAFIKDFIHQSIDEAVQDRDIKILALEKTLKEVRAKIMIEVERLPETAPLLESNEYDHGLRDMKLKVISLLGKE